MLSCLPWGNVSFRAVERAPKKTENWDFSELTKPVIWTVNKFYLLNMYVEQNLVQDLVSLWTAVRWWGNSYTSLTLGMVTLARIGLLQVLTGAERPFQWQISLSDRMEKWAPWQVEGFSFLWPKPWPSLYLLILNKVVSSTKHLCFSLQQIPKILATKHFSEIGFRD